MTAPLGCASCGGAPCRTNPPTTPGGPAMPQTDIVSCSCHVDPATCPTCGPGALDRLLEPRVEVDGQLDLFTDTEGDDA